MSDLFLTAPGKALSLAIREAPKRFTECKSQLAETPRREEIKKCKKWQRKYLTPLHSIGGKLAGTAQLLLLNVLLRCKETWITTAPIPRAGASERSNDYRDGKSKHPLTRTITLPENMLPLLEEYAVLARQLVEMLERWVAYELELLEHLCADWQQIQSIFLPDQL